MLRNTFLHIKGVGQATERRLWDAGILSWDDLLGSDYHGPRVRRIDFLKEEVKQAEGRLKEGDIGYFTQYLPVNQRWRIFPEFRSSVAYLDIETTGLDFEWNEITTIALYNGKEVKTYINGVNLDDFPSELMKYKVLVTYNGTCFDLPFLKRFFGISLPQAHIDLRYVLQSIGIKGGLKGCEERLGIDRGELKGFDGMCAAIAWREYAKTGDQKILETLLAYNCLDTVVLEHLMAKGYNLKLDGTPLITARRMDLPVICKVPFTPDTEWVKKIEAEADRSRCFFR